MGKIAVVYWSGTGNTQVMAEKIAEGVTLANGDVTVFTAGEFSSSMMDDFDAVAFGCPSMGSEQLEDSEFEPMFEDCKSKLDGKKIVLFGSYGWGGGEWMRNWEDDCKTNGAVLLADSVICCDSPDAEVEETCINLGKQLV